MEIWTRHLKEPSDKERFKKNLLNSRFILERLIEIMQEDADQLETNEISLSTYDSPSWSHQQAHKNGQRSQIRKYINLITLDQGAKK